VLLVFVIVNIFDNLSDFVLSYCL